MIDATVSDAHFGVVGITPLTERATAWLIAKMPAALWSGPTLNFDAKRTAEIVNRMRETGFSVQQEK